LLTSTLRNLPFRAAVLILAFLFVNASRALPSGSLWQSVPPTNATQIRIAYNDKIAKITFALPLPLKDALRVVKRHLLTEGWSSCKAPNKPKTHPVDYGRPERVPGIPPNDGQTFWVTQSGWWGQTTMSTQYKATVVVFKAVNYRRAPLLTPVCDEDR